MNSKLKNDDLKGFKKKLTDLRSRMTDEIGRIVGDNMTRSTKDSSGDLSGYSLHMADQASDNYDREFSLNMASNEQEVLYRIDAALKRIEDKSYGLCEVCQKKISKARLKIVPFAELCVPCQEKQEKEKK